MIRDTICGIMDVLPVSLVRRNTQLVNREETKMLTENRREIREDDIHEVAIMRKQETRQ